MRPSLTGRLARWMESHRNRGLPARIRTTARTFVLDWLGSALAGHATDPGEVLVAHARSRPAGACRVVGTTFARSAEVAALVNGGLSHIVEMDDLDRGSVVHPGAVVVPAALALAEREEASGPDLLDAVVVGYEVAIRVGEAVGREHYRYFHNTATCGVFGAAAAAAWLLTLDPERTTWALGTAGTQAAGLWEFMADGAMSKHLHPGRSAAGGVLSADLAARGFTGAQRILEGERGLFAATAPDARPERVVEGLDDEEEFRITGVSLKPHASCRHTHPAVDAALALRDRVGERPPETVRIATYGAAVDLCDAPDPRTPYEAKFSLQHCVALALRRGTVGLAGFTDAALEEPGIRELAGRTTVERDPELDARYPRAWSARVSVVTADGDELEAAVDAPAGDPGNPLPAARVREKFEALADHGGFGRDAGRLLSWTESLERPEPVKPPPLERVSPGR